MKLQEMWGMAENEYAVLSTAPPDVKSKSDALTNREVPHLCNHFWTERYANP